MRTSPAGWINFNSHWWPHTNLGKVLRLAEISGSSRRKSGVPRRLWASTAHCSNSVMSSAVKKPIKEGAFPNCGCGDPGPGEAAGETAGDGSGDDGGEGDGDSGFSATPGTTTSKGILIGWGATTITTTSSCSTSNSLSEFSSKYSSYCWFSILQQQHIKSRNYDPPALMPTPLLDDFVIFLIIPTLHLFVTPRFS